VPRGEGRRVASAVLNLLRPKPFRGDVVAAWVVVLTTLVWTVGVRFTWAWGAGVHLVVAAVACAFVTTIAVLASMEGDEPRAYQSVLYVAAVALFLDAVVRLARLLISGGGSAGTTAWVAAAVAVFALAFATRRNSAVSTLLGSLAGGIALLGTVEWIWSPTGVATDRWVLLALLVIYGFAAIGQRDRRLRHGVALIDAAGLATVAIGLTFMPRVLAPVVLEIPQAEGLTDVVTRVQVASWGWELLILTVGFGLIAYSSVDRQPGPAYLGVLNLIIFTLITSLEVSDQGATLLGWPLVLGGAAVFLLAIGLRPTTPAPPPPDINAPEPPPLPLR
jgi:hypothetical protein